MEYPINPVNLPVVNLLVVDFAVVRVQKFDSNYKIFNFSRDWMFVQNFYLFKLLLFKLFIYKNDFLPEIRFLTTNSELTTKSIFEKLRFWAKYVFILTTLSFFAKIKLDF